MTLYLHIGLHKTGTSSLQGFLGRNAEALKAAGLVWPKAGLVDGAHHNLGYELLGRPRFAAGAGGLEVLAAEIADAEAALVSSEELEFLELAEVRRLREALGERPVRVLINLRRQDALIASTFAQQARMGAMLGAFAEHATASLYQPRFDFSQLVLRWAGVFGREVLDVAVTDERADDAALIRHFLRRIELDADAPGWIMPRRRHNVSPGANEVELIRRASRRARRGGRRLEPETVTRIRTLAAERVKADASLQTGKLTLPPELYARTAARFGRGNRKVAEAHLNGAGAALEFASAPPRGGRMAPGPQLMQIASEIAEAALAAEGEAAHG